MASTHEPSPVGYDRAGVGQTGLVFQAANQLGHTGRGQPEKADVILTEVGPTGTGIRKSMQDTGAEPRCRPEIFLEPDHLDRLFESRVIESSGAIHHHDNAVGWESLVFEQAADDVPRQPGPAMGQDHCGDAEGIEFRGSVRHGGQP